MARVRVLVVEDEEAMAVGLEYALVREGYEVAVARDGAAARSTGSWSSSSNSSIIGR